MKKYKLIIQEYQNITSKLTHNELNYRVNICPNIPLGQGLANSNPMAKSSPVTGFDLYISLAMHGFHIFKRLEKSEKIIIFCDVKIV